MRLYFPVDLTGNLIMIEKLVLGEELLMEKVRNWKKGMEKKGLRVNTGKTKSCGVD